MLDSSIIISETPTFAIISLNCTNVMDSITRSANCDFLAIISALRTHPEGVPARRSRAGDELQQKTRPDSKSILCLSGVLGDKRLALKSARRKNDRRVSQLTRPCF